MHGVIAANTQNVRRQGDRGVAEGKEVTDALPLGIRAKIGKDRVGRAMANSKQRASPIQ